MEEHAIEPKIALGTKVLDADLHVFVTGARLSPVGAEQAVPPWQVESEVAVGLIILHGMMHAVHIRGNYNQPQQPVVTFAT